MFIDSSSEIEVKVHYKKVGKTFYAFTESEFKDLKDDEKDGFETLVVKMAELTWGMHNELQETSVDAGSDGDRKFNYKKFKENKLVKLIRSWDAKGRDLQPVPVSRDLILNLAPSIAETILRAYDEDNILSEEEEKN